MYTEAEVVAVMSGYTGILAIICLFVGVVYSYCTSPDRIEPHERIEIETLLCAIAIELIKSASPYRLREAARIVEIRSYKDRM